MENNNIQAEEIQKSNSIIKETLNYPTPIEELEVLNRIESNTFETGKKVVSIKEIKYLQELSKKVYIDEAIKNIL